MLLFRKKLAMAAYKTGQRLQGLDQQAQQVSVAQIFAEAELVFGVWDDPQQLAGIGYRLIKGRDLISREKDAVAVQIDEPWRVVTPIRATIAQVLDGKRSRSAPPAQDHELPEDFLERDAIVAPEIGDGFEVRLQGPQQPDDLNVAVTFSLKTAARPHPVEIAVNIELQEIGRSVTGTARRLRHDPRETSGRQIKPIDKGVNEADGVVGGDIIINRLGQQQKLRTFESRNVSHGRFYRHARENGIRSARLFTRSA